jgi:hypothetical protein
VEPRVFTDTTEFYSIDCGDIIEAGERRYKVTGHERERRFGVEDPKFWVKRAVDLATGEKKIVKLSFFESFETRLGGVRIRCFRNPEKEANILSLVQRHPHFMQGISCKDTNNNCVRVLDIVRGVNFFVYLDSLTMTYEAYYKAVLPDILRKLVKAIEAIRFLHIQGYKHGDIRNDHLIVERQSGDYVWIDFDFDYDGGENPYSLDLFGLGNILLYTVGKGFHGLHAIQNDRVTYGDLVERIEPGDFSMLDQWRLVNLRKLYPFITPLLNDILLHFSRGAELYYEFSEELIEDLNRCTYTVFQQ